ncbi:MULTISPECIES: aminopeptidase N [unclassified Variovorax]|uniref:aminopeptidase N n=1 Tax=unclassified Variovorax TaxID=663243 RepID=UPI002B2391E7|nr:MULTISPECIES: aminopeptidase N [unclassified Variovorax]MEB0055892.1 aminopeptidase N [Variovorax sp. LG9.2]MEB0114544.1 aminopeptidase N [Variovorax sp. RTB1]
MLLRDAQGQPVAIRREDYVAPAYWIDTVELTFDLDPNKTRVLNRMRMRRNPAVPVQPLRLDGDELNLARVLVDNHGASFRIEGDQLVIDALPDAFELEIFTTCCPIKNTKLMGLFVSEDTFFTQCEAEGFRRITYFLDRPDVMASYTVTLRASKYAYPVLLSNGNLVEHGDLEGPGNEGRHFAKWVDPFKKPAYLFALVAGKLVAREQRITARNGKEHLLQVYVRAGDLDKTEHAMNSLVNSVLWDEARFGLPLDLDRFMIVATSDFNMGAMENKGLNIFNTKYVLANQATATDADYSNIESVVGHEYFHNWSGDRVTCRDWFQLSLKEGLTVFRDQEFSQDLCADASARAVKRIEDVRVLRTAQFPEDAGPMAHPVRPDSYIEISNFYTVTIYEKGAEVVRMMQTLVGRKGFERGITLYFERFDGQAVTCDDFAHAIADANPDSDLASLLPQFKRWYAQAGTPRLAAQGNYDAAQRSYTLSFAQSCAPTPGQPIKEAFVIPVNLGLLSADGHELPLQLEGESDAAHGTRALVLTQEREQITFINLDAEPVPSILRGFSAPVILDFDYSDTQLLTLLANDVDPFNRWEAGQRLGLRSAIQAITGDANATGPALNEAYVDAMRGVLRDPNLDAAFKELVLALPSETYISEQLEVVDPQRVHAVREAMRVQLATALFSDWQRVYEENQDTGAYSPDPTSSGRRALAGMALTYLCIAARESNDTVWPGKTLQRFKDAGNMTDRFNALNALVSSGHALAAQALARFHAIFKDEALVIDKWFSLQAGAPDRNGDILPLVKQLMKHPDFSIKNPNRARSVIFSYCSGNPGAFHRPDAAGYVFWSDRVIELDAINPQVAARLARGLDRWSKLAEPYRSAAREAIARVAAKPDLSKDTHEVVTRALAV